LACGCDNQKQPKQNCVTLHVLALEMRNNRGSNSAMSGLRSRTTVASKDTIA
jgi:hypothetical protein